MPTEPKIWSYKGYNVYPADRNSNGIRWYAHSGNGYKLRSDTKAGMRQLITDEIQNNKNR